MAAFFVGRRDELKRMNEMLVTARAGQGCAALVSGEAGIGKTSLAEELAKAAAWMGVRALWGPAIEAEGAPPFWPWRQALRGLIDLGERTQIPDIAESGSARFRFFERSPPWSTRRQNRMACSSSSTTSTGRTPARCGCCR